jgi:hypothetical protein
MNEDNFEYVRAKMSDEGFHYCFAHYGSFPEIKDEKFHELREQYLKVADELEKYINDKAQDYFMGVDEEFDEEGF